MIKNNKTSLLNKKILPKSKIVFASYPKKVIDKKYINTFWKKYFDGTLENAIYKRKDRSYISNYNTNVKIIPLSPTTAVTIRKCSIGCGKKYMKTANFFKKRLANIKLKHSEVLLADIIDYKEIKDNYYIMERIIPSISILDFMYLDLEKIENRFQSSFLKKLKNINKKKFNDKLNLAYKELKTELNNINIRNRINIDYASNNVIIIDYNKETDMFKFGLIDFTGFISKSF